MSKPYKSPYPADFDELKNAMVQHVFKTTDCWCRPSREGFYFQNTEEATEVLFISWDDMYQCYKDQNPQTVEQLFGCIHHDNYSVISDITGVS